ncbi:ImmA/IrrE family metallo-endopeptidase [Erythrobacter aureus]|nr:ImmA/IrrE family metallo-endopeptidase [Erythrobacter aureus]
METDLSVVMRHVRQPPAHFPSIFEELEIGYHELPVESHVSGWIQLADGSYSVLVNRNESDQRKRLIAAHALAIFLLYRDKFHFRRSFGRHTFNLWGDLGEGLNEFSPLDSSYERMANKLAIQMLMPAATIRKLWLELPDADDDAKVSSLAARFAVSDETMKIRAKTLNLVERPSLMPDLPSLAPSEPVLA